MERRWEGSILQFVMNQLSTLAMKEKMKGIGETHCDCKASMNHSNISEREFQTNVGT
jgi:hypothetical protein